MSGFADMEMDDERQLDAVMPMGGDRARYPYGLRICLCDDELKKLGLKGDKFAHGEYMMLKVIARVTSFMTSDGSDDEPCCRAEMQIEKIKVIDDAKELAEGDD